MHRKATVSRFLGPSAHVDLFIHTTDPVARWSVRARGSELDLLEGLLDRALPREPLSSIDEAGLAALNLWPDEWLLIWSDRQIEAERRALLGQLSGRNACCVDVTQRSISVELLGQAAAWVINSACPLDLSRERFPAGSCTRTVLGKSEVVLWRRSAHAHYLECARSFFPYVWRLLNLAAAEAELDLSIKASVCPLTL